MKQLNRRPHMMGLGKAHPHMLGCALYRCVDGVEIKIAWIFDITCHHGTLKEMDVIHLFDNTRGIINVGQIGFAVVITDYIYNMYRGPGGTIMHTRS